MTRKNILLTVLCLYTSICTGQLTEDRFLTPNTAWIEGFGYETEGRYQVSPISLLYYTMDGDTLIDGKSYYRIRLSRACSPMIYYDWDNNGNEIILDKNVEVYDGDLYFFMREDESGDVWLYTDDTNTLRDISGNVFYHDIDQNYASGLVRHDLFLFNTRKPYSAGDKKPFGTIAFDSPEALYDGHNLLDWCIDSMEVKEVTDGVMLDGKEHWVSIYNYDLKYVQGIGPLWAGGPLSGVGHPSTYQRVFFAFYQGDQIIYRNEGYLSAIEEHFPDILKIVTGKNANGINLSPDPSPIGRGTLVKGDVYDLSGRKISLFPFPSPIGRGGTSGSLPKGVYIVNGKKVLVK